MWLSKIGMWITILGAIALWYMGATDTGLIAALISGGVMVVPGWIFGWKAFGWGVSPIGILSMSSLAIFENRLVSSIVWGIRFFFLACLVVFIICLCTA